VTGAGTGIGKACAQILVKNGYHVVFTGRRIEVLNQAINELGDLSEHATAFALDISLRRPSASIVSNDSRSI
jgi:NADP-dependent 3-hydroxy acid dehydrogenase YdfG